MMLSNRVKDLLEGAYKEYYNIRSDCVIEVACVEGHDFDLNDSTPISVLDVGDGQFSFHGKVSDEVVIAAYEGFVNQCVSPRSFLTGRKKCDYLLIRGGESGFTLLLELSSALGDVSGLSLPIFGKRKRVVLYSEGKYAKAEDQLSSSLRDLLAVPEVADFLLAKPMRICLMSYRIYPHTDPDYLSRHPFERYLAVESAETKENGAIISCSAIEAQGFEFRRICHPNVFSI